MPRVTRFELPLDELAQIAQSSGLQWVNSNAERVATVAAAIAAEPKPVHVPRERPAPVAIDDRPLILVETRRDLRNMTLPFEDAAAGYGGEPCCPLRPWPVLRAAAQGAPRCGHRARRGAARQRRLIIAAHDEDVL
jgi:hypothetical protein